MSERCPRCGAPHDHDSRHGVRWYKCYSTDDMQSDTCRLLIALALLDTAVDAWESGSQLWQDGVLYTEFRQAALTTAWYEEARKVLGGEA